MTFKTLELLALVLACHFVYSYGSQDGFEPDRTIKCKYVLIEKNYFMKLQQQQQQQQQQPTMSESNHSSWWLFQKHFNFGMSGRVELLKSHLFKWHVDDCLNVNILDRIDVVNNLFRFNSDVAKFRYTIITLYL